MILHFRKNIQEDKAETVKQNSFNSVYIEKVNDTDYSVEYDSKGGIMIAQLCARFLNKENTDAYVILDIISQTLVNNPEVRLVIPVKASAMIVKYLNELIVAIEEITDKDLCPSEELLREMLRDNWGMLLKKAKPHNEVILSFWKTVSQMSLDAWFLERAIENDTDIVLVV